MVVLWDPQRGEEAEKADVLAVTGMWVIPVPEAEPAGMVVLPSSGSGLRSQGWGSGLPTEVAGPKRQPGASRPVTEKTGPKGRKRTRAEAGESARAAAGESSRGAKRRKVTAAATGTDPGNSGNAESEVLTPTDQQAQQDAQQRQKRREETANSHQAKKAAAARVVVLEELAGRGQLTEEQAAELSALQPKVAQRNQQKKETNAKYYRARKAAADRVAELEELKERGPLTEELAAELAELRPKVAQWKQQTRENDRKFRQARRAAADRVAELEKLKERGPLTEEQAAELAELQPKTAQRKQQKKEKNAKQDQARRAAADRVAELEKLKERGPLTEEQAAELAELQPKTAQRRQQERAKNAKYRQGLKAAADRVVVLEELAGRGPLTEEQEAELAALRPKAQQKQQTKEKDVEYHQRLRAAAARVAELEKLKERGPLTEEQAAELAALQPKVAQRKQQTKEYDAKFRRARKAAADRIVVLEELAGRGPLTEEQEAELAALQPKAAQRKQQEREKNAKYHQGLKAAADRVAVLEELAGRGPLTEEQEAELAALQPKAAQRKQQEREKNAKYHQGLKAAADRVAVLEELAGRGPLTEEQEAELAALQPKAAQRGRKKKDREVMETGAGAAPVAGRDERIAAPDGVSEWTETDQDGRDACSADFDLGARIEQAEADSAVSRHADAGGAGAMLGEGAVGDVPVTALPPFLGQDAGDNAGAGGAGAVARGDDFAGFLPDYHDGVGSVALFGVDGPGGMSAGDRGGQVGLLEPPAIAALAELTGRMERHLNAMPPDVDPRGVRKNVERAKRMVRQGYWTLADVQTAEARLPGVRKAERALHDIRLAKVREVYEQAKQAIAQGYVPVVYFNDGVPGGVSSRPDVRLGFEVEFKLPAGDFGYRASSLGTVLEQEGLVDWKAQGSQLIGKEAAKAMAASGRWALIKEGPPFEVEATSPILRNDGHGTVWPSMEKLLSAVQRQGGYGSESGGHINVSFDWQLTPVQYVRVAQVAKVFEAVLYWLGNVAGGDGSKQRNVTFAGPIPLPSDPYTVDDDTGAYGYRSLPNLNDRNRAVRFDGLGFEGDRLEFRGWAGDAGELTGNPALWQVRAELSAAIMLAGTDPTIYRELDRLMADPDLLGYDDQIRDEGAWLEKLVEFLELLPLSEAGQAQVVQLFAWTRPWKLTGDTAGHSALVVGLPERSVLFPVPGMSKAQVVAQAYSYQLYKKTRLVVAWLSPDGDGILLRNNVIDFAEFANLLKMRHAGWRHDEWTVLAIPGGARHGELLELVLGVVEGPVLVTVDDLYKTPDGRLLTGVYELDQTGGVQFRPSISGWTEFTPENRFGRVTDRADMGEALLDSRIRRSGEPAEVYPYWSTRGSGA